MAGLGHAKGGADEWIVELLGQLQGGAPTVGALGVGQPVTLAVGIQRLAGSSPQLFRSPYRVAGSDFPPGVVKQLLRQSCMFVCGGSWCRHR